MKKLNAGNDAIITEEILKRVRQFNYIPTKKTAEHAEGLLAEYKKSLAETKIAIE